MNPMALSREGAFHAGLTLDGVRRLFHHLLSFEVLFVGFIHSNSFKQVLPTLPVDETLIFAGLCCLCVIWIVLREGIYKPGLYVVIAYMAFVGWVVLSYSWSPSRIFAKQTISYLATFGVLSVAAGSLIIANRRERAVRFLIALLIASLYFSIHGIVIHIEHGSFRFYEGFARRTYLLWGYAATNGAVIAFAIAIYSRFGSSKQIVALMLLTIMAYFLMVASGRGALLSLGIACLVPLIISRPVMRRGYLGLPRWQLAALGAIMVVIAYSSYLVASGASIDTFNRFAQLFNQARNPDLVLAVNRFAYFAAAIQQWLQNPIVGGGVSSFSIFFYGFESAGGVPHNLILELLSQYGIVGFLLFAHFVVSAARHADPRRLRVDPLQLCIVMLFISRLTGAMFSIQLSVNFPFLAFLGLLALRSGPSMAEDRRQPLLNRSS